MRSHAFVFAWMMGFGLAGCSDRFGAEEAPPIASLANIPAAPPGAQGVVFDSPRPYGAGGTATGVPRSNPKLPKEDPEAPDPEFPDPNDDTPDPFQSAPTPSSKPPKPPKPDPSGTVVGPLPKGVQL